MTLLERGVPAPAIALVDLGLGACTAYRRPDLVARLAATRHALATPAVHVVVVGDFKQGKSSLVNALLGVDVCPVDDNVATAVPTYLRHGEQLSAELEFDGERPRREPVAIDDVRHHVLEGGGTRVERPTGVEIRVPSDALAGGLVVVDTPGVGGLGSVHGAASLVALSMADAALFVTDAEEELNRKELDFLRQARNLCRTVVCVLTKTDFYPGWRAVRSADERLLSAGLEVPVVAVSVPLRMRAVETGDAALDEESGFAGLGRLVAEEVVGGAAAGLAASAAGALVAVCDQLAGQLEAEHAALADPEAARQVVDALAAAQAPVDALCGTDAAWRQVLDAGITRLGADLEADLRARVDLVVQEAEDAIDTGDPADTWPQMTSWLQARMSYDLIENYVLLRERAGELAEQVATRYREGVAAASAGVPGVAVDNPIEVLSRTRVDGPLAQGMMQVGGPADIVLAPIEVGIALVMGHQGLRDEKERQQIQRRTQAKNAVRHYCDEVSLVMGRDSRDALGRIERELRERYGALAGELGRSNAHALEAASAAVRCASAQRAERLAAVESELARLAELRQRAQAAAGRVSAVESLRVDA